MTKAEFRERVKLEGRVTVNNLDSLIDSIASETLDDYAMKSRYPELLVPDSPITLVDAQSTYALPLDYQNFGELRYAVRGSVAFASLKERNDYTSRRSHYGYPRFFTLSSLGLSLFPYGEVKVGDTLLLSYYRKPSSLWMNDGDEFPVPRLQTSILKETLSRIQRFHKSSEGGPMKADAQASFVAAESGR